MLWWSGKKKQNAYQSRGTAMLCQLRMPVPFQEGDSLGFLQDQLPAAPACIEGSVAGFTAIRQQSPG